MLLILQFGENIKMNFKIIRLLLAVMFILLYKSVVFSETGIISDSISSIKLSNGIPMYSIGEDIYILEDKEKKYTIKDIISEELSDKFIKSTDKTPGFGFTKSVYWVRLKLDAKKTNVKNWYLELDYPLMDSISLFTRDGKNNYTSTETGYNHPFINRELKHRNFVFKLNINPGEEKTYYLRFENQDRMEIPLNVWSADSFISRDHSDQFILGVYYGIFLIMIIYHLILFFFLKETSYLYYSLFITTYAFFQLTQNGLAYEYFWPAFLNQHYIPLLDSIMLITIIQFTQSFLNSKINSTIPHKIFNFLKVAFLLHIIISFFIPYSLSNQIVIFLIVITILTIIASGIQSLLKKYRPAKFYMLAWTFFLASSIVYILKILAVIPSNNFTTFSIQIGSVVLIILFSYGLGDRLNIMRKEKHLAEKGISEANKTILLSTQKYKLIVETSNDIIFSLDERFNFISVNKAIKNTLRITPDAVLKLNFLDLVYDGIEGIEVGASEFLAKQIVKEKLEQLLKTRERVSFTMDMISSHIIEPKEMVVTLEYIDIEGKAEILGRASSVIEDTLLKFFTSEKQMFSLGNYLVSADEISHRATKNLRKYIDQKEISMIRVALREIIINSIEHGNLDITFEEKTESLKAGTYLELVSRRQRDPRNTDKRVEIEYLINNEKAVYKISDEGKGFNYEGILNADMNSLNEKQILHGRGILMAKNIFDEITYNKKGNQVMLVKKFI